jgi:hypothetical protein
MSDEMVIFTRTFDLLTWLLPQTEKFPKSQRFIVTKRLTDAILDFQEALFQANAHRKEKRLIYLRDADACLGKLRLYVRLAYQWKWFTVGQFEHVSKMIEEIGKLLGGWLKQSQL